MDFANRTQQPAAPAHAGAGATRKGSADNNKVNRIVTVVLAALVGIVLLFAIVSLAGNKGNKEEALVDTTKLQAVFLNTGQVYFGNVKELNSKYFVLTNIYYLQTASNGQTGQNANTSVSLVKLGCELHEPFDKMVINRDQENLQDGGQVAKAVSTFEKQNPNGQKCADQSSASSTNSGNNAQPAGTTNNNSTNTTNP
jgi:hypothetical protein